MAKLEEGRVTHSELAKALGVTERTLYNRGNKKLPHIKLGRNRWYTVEETKGAYEINMWAQDRDCDIWWTVNIAHTQEQP